MPEGRCGQQAGRRWRPGWLGKDERRRRAAARGQGPAGSGARPRGGARPARVLPSPPVLRAAASHHSNTSLPCCILHAPPAPAESPARAPATCVATAPPALTPDGPTRSARTGTPPVACRRPACCPLTCAVAHALGLDRLGHNSCGASHPRCTPASVRLGCTGPAATAHAPWAAAWIGRFRMKRVPGTALAGRGDGAEPVLCRVTRCSVPGDSFVARLPHSDQYRAVVLEMSMV
jgi:hypothetical protein